MRFEADRANAPGAVTELLAQRLKGPNNAAKRDGYGTLGYATFATGGFSAGFDLPPGPYALATRFIEGESGRMGALMPIGRVIVG